MWVQEWLRPVGKSGGDSLANELVPLLCQLGKARGRGEVGLGRGGHTRLESEFVLAGLDGWHI